MTRARDNLAVTSRPESTEGKNGKVYSNPVSRFVAEIRVQKGGSMVGDKSVRDAAKALTEFFLRDWLPHFSNVTDLRDYSRVDMLHEFIDWMFDRACRGVLPDLRVIRHQGAQSMIEAIKEGVTEQCLKRK